MTFELSEEYELMPDEFQNYVPKSHPMLAEMMNFYKTKQNK